jgi:hypothetical protein
MSDQAFSLKNPKKTHAGFNCDLVENSDGCAVARVKKRYGERPVWVFSSTRSEQRFDAYCGECSRRETFAAMLTHLPESWKKYS